MRERKTAIEDFLYDEDFIQWVLRPSVEMNKYWQAWIEAHPESRKDVQKAKELILSFSFKTKKPHISEKNEVLQKVLKEVNESAQKSTTDNTKRLVLISSIAACLAIFFLLFNSEYLSKRLDVAEDKVVKNTETIKEAPKGIKIQTILPDGSKVWINSGSKLTYGPEYGLKERVVYLSGEAFFEVEKNEDIPFVVRSGELRVIALGTSFNVNSLTNKKSSVVALVTGKVEVIKDKGSNKESVILTPGQKVTHSHISSSFVKSPFSLYQEIGWKSGILYFENAGFEEIKDKLERWYGVTIESTLHIKENWNYTGQFDNQSLEIVLKRLAYSKKFKFEIENKNVQLYN